MKNKEYEFNSDCCTHYNGTKTFYVGYAILPCFKVAVCNDCEEATFVCGKFFASIFEHFFQRFWKGDIHINTKKIFKLVNDKLIELQGEYKR